jgi:hypothetical protein
MLPRKANRACDEFLRAQQVERYRIAAPVRFKWRTSSGGWREGRGITRNISDSGLFVLAYPVPVPGASIKVTVEIPRMGVLLSPMVLHGEGTVTRVEPEDAQPIGFDASVVLDDEVSSGW